MDSRQGNANISILREITIEQHEDGRQRRSKQDLPTAAKSATICENELSSVKYTCEPLNIGI